MNTYLILKHLHVSMVVLTFLSFSLRVWWMWSASPRLTWRSTRTIPHLIDTVLLGSAIGLTIQVGQYPFVNGWLTAKVFLLLAYIGFGTVALKRGRTLRTRLAAAVAAYGCFFWIVRVAIDRQWF